MRSVIFFVILLFIGLPVTAQIYNSGAEIVIQSGTQVYTPGLQNEGRLLNNGALIVYGDISQYAGKYAGTGQVFLAGNNRQLISVNRTRIAELTIDNPAGATLSGAMELTKSLSLINGLIYTSAVDTLLISTSTGISGGSPESFISGPLHRKGTGTLFYPVGWTDTYLPVTLEQLRGGTSLTSSVEVKTNLPVSGNSTYQLLEPYYWERHSYGDTFGGTKVVLPLFDEFVDRNSLVLASASADLSTYDTPSEVSFISGEYYPGVLSLSEIYGEVMALAIADPSLADVAPFYVPNAINAGAMEEDNRVIKVYGDVMEENFLYVVFDRRGSEIFKTGDLEFMRSTGWDGRIGQTGKMAPSGSYIYAVKGETSDGMVIDQTGQVVIIK